VAILRSNGFVQLRRGLQEHITNGSMSVGQLGIYCLILWNADPSTGIWCGSAGVIAALSGESPRTCRHALDRLEKAEYIKRFFVQGSRLSYPILVHRFNCSDGAMKGKRLNALETKDYRHIVYEGSEPERSERGSEAVGESGSELAGKYLDNKRTENKRQKTSRDKREPDSRHIPFREALATYWQHKNPIDPEMPWQGRDAKALSDLLSASPSLTLEQFRDLLRNRAKSAVAHGDRIFLWIAKIHSYSEPLNEFNKPEGAQNGHRKHSGLQSPAIERQRRTLDNLKQAMVNSGDYSPGHIDGQDGRLLPAPGDEHGDVPGIPVSAPPNRK
jgi:hypothetical protein